MPVTVKEDNVDKMVKAVAALTGKECLVGIPAEATARGDGTSNALLGYVHEFGSPARNIPARPFLYPGIRAVQDKIESTFRKAAEAALKGDEKAGDVALNTVGLLVQSSVKKQIVEGHFVPLRPATIAARRRKGFESDKPLVVTGSMLNSITYVIRPKDQ